MALGQNDKPAGGRPPQSGMAIGVIAIGAVATAALILALLKNVPLPLRVLLVAGELLTAALACWAVSRAARR